LSERNSVLYRALERFTGLQPRGCRGKTAVADSGGMSTLSHTSNHHFEVRTRIALIAVVASAAVALIVALVLATGSTSSSPVAAPQPTTPELQQQLESVNGARYGLTHSAASTSPKQQLQAVAGARYGQPVGVHTSR
jgi:hypothetical protein